MTNEERADVSRKLIRKAFEESNQTANLTTDEVRILINDLDTFLDANANVINQAITLSVRNKASAEMKALAVAWVALKRAGAV
jgi:hypothetical protein